VRKTLVVDVRGVKIGGNNPVVVQSMTSGMRSNPDDVQAIARDESNESILLASAGSELIRIALNNENAAKAIPYIRENLDKAGFEKVPLVGCGQYEIKQILEKFPECIKALGKIRINPGNIGFGAKRDKNFEETIELICKYDIPIRIGVNWGSLDQYLLKDLMDKNAVLKNPKSDNEILRNALVVSALSNAEKAIDIGLQPNKIILSCKTSNFSDLVAVYTELHEKCDNALHLGLTEAGMGIEGIIKTTTALSVLLNNGIGDTIRASLTQSPGESRITEVKVCQHILQSLGLRSFSPQITSCPGCGRTSGSYFQQLTSDIKLYVSENLENWKKLYKGVEDFKLAVMGCVVNGPGESKHADIGISIPGYNEKKIVAVFVDGKLYTKLTGDSILDESKIIINNYIKNKYTDKKR
jgi:(E)-4-hydroxy-3-methylbut-2-enyl-diphosphate synthase